MTELMQEEFGNSIGFYIVGKKQIIYCSEVNARKYAPATLKGAGMRDISNDTFQSYYDLF